ncbi:MAG: glycine zipper 2TM domain-containing protein [Candidatus Omnitrophica bacterium]|nr:glycine zipper 2TM domain-containing protein [Candidatus Omnitrophota bacterium]
MIRSVSRISAVLILVVASVSLAGCQTSGAYGRRAPESAVFGSLFGAGVGAIAGHQSDSTAEGALLGAAIGGAGGYMIGNEQDKDQLYAETAQARRDANIVVINVQNSNGSITPVTVQRRGNIYVGPRGEHYFNLPTEDQLRPVYGF